MNKLKQAIVLIARLLIVIIAMLIAFIVSTAVIRTGIEMSPQEASQAGLAALIVSAINSLVLAYVILRSRWTGLKLIAAVFFVHFGIETFMTQIETLYFNGSIAMPIDTVIRVIATGLVRALIFGPLAVLMLGKFKGTSADEGFPHLPVAEWVKRFAILSVAYVVFYFEFGYYVAWQWPEVRQYYSGSTAIQPFFTHILNTFTGDPVLPLFQILRGAMWAAIALLIVRMIKGGTLEKGLVVGITLGVILASGVIFPNPFMPAMVRQAHLYELSSSMLAFGVIAVWVWTRQTKDTKPTQVLDAKTI